MEFKKVENWYGQVSTFEEFSNKVAIPALSGILNESTTVVFLNWHTPSTPIGLKKISEIFKEYISENTKDNKNKLFVINYGYHAICSQRNFDCLRPLCYTAGPDLKGCKTKYKSEIVYEHKEGVPLASFYTQKKGYSVVWMCWDSVHVLSNSAIKLWEYIFNYFAITTKNKNIFNESYYKSFIESEDKMDNVDFISIRDRALEEIGGEKNIDKVVDEMIEKAPIKEIVLFLNQLIKTNRICGRSLGSEKLHADNEMVKKWLLDWAKNKWPYYILFGRNLEIKERYEMELSLSSDSILINDMIKSLKDRFLKYAPALDAIPASSFERNIMDSESSLRKYKSVASGIKLTKYLSEFFNDKEFDIALSEFIQNKKFSSIAHISINPMDYLTQSINNHNWTSCHNMFNGSYKFGPLSYMFDGGTLVAFMAKDTLYNYDFAFNDKPFHWNSKCWRQIIYGNYNSSEFVFCREYPQEYKNPDLRLKIRKMLESQISEFCGIKNSWKIKENGAKLRKNYINNAGSYHYDDVPTRQTFFIRHKYNKESELIKVGSSKAEAYLKNFFV